MDMQDSINCSKEELIIWCAPQGGQRSKSKWVYTTRKNSLGVSLMQQAINPSKLSDEDRELLDQNDDSEDGEVKSTSMSNKFGIYRSEYDITQYDRTARNNFLVPMTSNVVEQTHEFSIKLFDSEAALRLRMEEDKLQGIQFSEQLENIINQKIAEGVITKYKSARDLRLDLIEQLRSVHIPYKVSLTYSNKQEIDLKPLQYIIEQQINC